jgi:hypothetical protein
VTSQFEKIEPGSPADERLKQSIQGALGDARDSLARRFGDEVYAQRLQVTRNALDVALAGIDALFSTAGQAAESLRLLGAKAAAETNGETVEDANVVAKAGDKVGAAQLPDIDEKALIERDGSLNSPADAAPGNMTTDPQVNPNLED